MSVGVHGLIAGLFGINNTINTAFSLVHLGLGLYWTIKSSIKLSMDPVAKIFDLWIPLKRLFSRRNKNGIQETISKGRTGRRRKTSA